MHGAVRPPALGPGGGAARAEWAQLLRVLTVWPLSMSVQRVRRTASLAPQVEPAVPMNHRVASNNSTTSSPARPLQQVEGGRLPADITTANGERRARHPQDCIQAARQRQGQVRRALDGRHVLRVLDDPDDLDVRGDDEEGILHGSEHGGEDVGDGPRRHHRREQHPHAGQRARLRAQHPRRALRRPVLLRGRPRPAQERRVPGGHRARARRHEPLRQARGNSKARSRTSTPRTASW